MWARRTRNLRPAPGTPTRPGAIRTPGGIWIPHTAPGSNGVPDSTGANPPGQMTGTFATTPGPFGGTALKFDGTTNKVDFGAGAPLITNWAAGSGSAPEDHIKLSGWAWVNLLGGAGGPIFSKGNNSPDTGVIFGCSTTTLFLEFIGSGNLHESIAFSPPASGWFMIGFSALHAGSSFGLDYSLVFNGKPLVTTHLSLGTQNQDAADTFHLWGGWSEYGSNDTGRTFFQGAIDHWGLERQAFYDAEKWRSLYAKPFGMFDQRQMFFPGVSITPTGTIAQTTPKTRQAATGAVTGVAGAIAQTTPKTRQVANALVLPAPGNTTGFTASWSLTG